MRKSVRYIYVIVLMLVFTLPVKSQQLGFDFPPNVNRALIHFETYNNLIIIPVKINGSIELKFILDTGVQYPILTEKFFADFLGLEYVKKIQIQGPGAQDSIAALVAKDVKLELPGGVTSGINQFFLVLEQDFLDLKGNLGEDVYGIIGYDIFSRFAVEVNYEDKYLILHEPRKLRNRKRYGKKYKKLPMQVVNTKPHVEITVNKNEDTQKTLKLMVDTGASHSVLLNNPEDDSLIPDTNITSVIGRGLGGDIYGHLGRLAKVEIGKYELEQPIVSFPRKGDYGSIAMKGSHLGTVGGELLSRFNVVFDYYHENIYLKKNKNYSRGFEYDMSGLNLVAHSPNFDRFRVTSVRHGSPAYEAGLRTGDVILTINGHSYESITLGGAYAMLRMKPGKKITVRVKEGDKSIKKSFRLERFI